MRWLCLRTQKRLYYLNAELLSFAVSFSNSSILRVGREEFGISAAFDFSVLKALGARKLLDSVYIWPDRLDSFRYDFENKLITIGFGTKLPVEPHDWLFEGKLALKFLNHGRFANTFIAPDYLVAAFNVKHFYAYAFSIPELEPFSMMREDLYNSGDYVQIGDFLIRLSNVLGVTVNKSIDNMYVLLFGQQMYIGKDPAKKLIDVAGFQPFEYKWYVLYTRPDIFSVRLNDEPQKETEVRLRNVVVDLARTNAIEVSTSNQDDCSIMIHSNTLVSPDPVHVSHKFEIFGLNILEAETLIEHALKDHQIIDILASHETSD